MTYALAKTDGGTELTIDVSVSSFEGPEMVSEHEAGWTSALTRLEAQFTVGLAEA
ncbi:MAG: hypothetical protein MK098_05260 [Marinovum sp.]|nr:hypothetical protein [Marinovum sp.]